MGMYDNFSIEYPLPVEMWIPEKYKNYIYHTIHADGFQSQSMDCALLNYFIDNNGHIYIDEISLFDEPEERIKREKIYFHGHIKVYSLIDLSEDDEKSFLWLEYDLKFTDSLLVSATMTSPTKKDFYELH